MAADGGLALLILTGLGAAGYFLHKDQQREQRKEQEKRKRQEAQRAWEQEEAWRLQEQRRESARWQELRYGRCRYCDCILDVTAATADVCRRCYNARDSD